MNTIYIPESGDEDGQWIRPPLVVCLTRRVLCLTPAVTSSTFR